MKFLVEKVFTLIRINGVKAPYSVRNISNLASKDVLRSTSGRLSLITDDSTTNSFLPFFGFNSSLHSNSNSDEIVDIDELDYKNEPAPAIDVNTFKNYLMVPPLGLRRFFSSELVKIDENKDILYKQYVPGSLAAHNYPLTVLPVKYSRRINSDIFVKTFVEDERNFKITSDNRKIKLSLSPGLKVHDSYPLLHKVCGNLSLLFIFSGDLPNCQYNSVQKWLNYPRLLLGKNDSSASSFVPSHSISQRLASTTNHSDSVENKVKISVVLNSPCNRLLFWAYNRYLETLARTIVEENKFMSITRKLSVESTIGLHQYRKQLPSVLLVDRNGYIRWHAIGYPTFEAVTILNDSISKLLN